MNKKDMAAQLSERAGISQVKATELLTVIFDGDNGIIANALNENDKVLVAGFGTFEVKTRAARRGTNPATGTKIDIPAKKAIGFKVGKTLKERIEV
jgi:nucleoid DNA-binding protein